MPDSSAPTVRALAEVAKIMRRALEGALEASGRGNNPAGACALGCLLLQTGIARFTDHVPIIRGGDGERHEGIRKPDGAWVGHYWVEVAVAGRTFVVDITADQFGWPPLVCSGMAEVLSRYRAGAQAEVDDHIASVRHWLHTARFP